MIFSILTDMLKIFFICLYRLSCVLFPLYVSILFWYGIFFVFRPMYSCTCDTHFKTPRKVLPSQSDSQHHHLNDLLYSLFHRCHILSYFIWPLIFSKDDEVYFAVRLEVGYVKRGKKEIFANHATCRAVSLGSCLLIFIITFYFQSFLKSYPFLLPQWGVLT